MSLDLDDPNSLEEINRINDFEKRHVHCKGCPGCGGPKGRGPAGCCAKCWRGPIPPKKRRHVSADAHETQ